MWPGRRRSDGHRGRIDGHVDRGGAVARRDAGADAEAPLGINAHREGGGLLFGVPVGHLRQAELIAPLAGERKADQPAPMQGHEVDGLGRDELRRANQVALVLAVLVIGDDDQLAVLEIVNRLLDGPENHGAPFGGDE